MKDKLRWGLLFLVLVGCVPSVKLADVEDAAKKAECARLQRCGVASKRTSCEVWLGLGQFPAAIARFLTPAVEEGLVRYDEAAMGQCLARYANDSDCMDRSMPTCEEAFTGLIPQGEPCPGVGCVPGSSCVGASNLCGGVCVADTPIGAVPNEAPCVSGASEVLQPDGGVVCAAPLGEGASCAVDYSCGDRCPRCAPDLDCRPSAGFTTRTCVKRRPVELGQACDWYYGPPCGPAASCDFRTNVCVPLGDLGDACGGCLKGL